MKDTMLENMHPTKNVITFYVLNLYRYQHYAQNKNAHCSVHYMVILIFICRSPFMIDYSYNYTHIQQQQSQQQMQPQLTLPQSKHSALLAPILTSLPSLFATSPEWQQKPSEPTSSSSVSSIAVSACNLRIFITQSPDQKLNNFIYFYTLPVSLDQFVQFNQDVQVQKNIDVNIAKYDILEDHGNLKVMYLAYKKVLLISGRDFIYARANFVIDGQLGREYWVVSTSILGQDQTPGLIRGEIIKSALKAVEKDGKVQISVFSQVDMKMQLKPQATKSKGVLQIKKYIQKCYEYLGAKKQKQNSEIKKQVQKQYTI